MLGFSANSSMVLFDRLLVRRRRGAMNSVYSSNEVLAIISHEIGHWSLNHLPKQILFRQVRHARMAFLQNSYLHHSCNQ